LLSVYPILFVVKNLVFIVSWRKEISVPEVEFGDVATWLATLVAIVSAVAAFKSSRDANKYQKEAARHNKESAGLLADGHQLKLKEWIDQYFNSVRSWAEQVCLAISEAAHIVEDSDISSEHKRPVLVRLSSLIDTGRWYFPNQWAEDHGTHKEPAYRGVRQPVLDCVVGAYDLLRGAQAHEVRKADLIAVQREFVSHIQAVLDPRKREQEVMRIITEFEVSERLRNAPSDRL
jgi:hypothetical protein